MLRSRRLTQSSARGVRGARGRDAASASSRRGGPRGDWEAESPMYAEDPYASLRACWRMVESARIAGSTCASLLSKHCSTRPDGKHRLQRWFMAVSLHRTSMEADNQGPLGLVLFNGPEQTRKTCLIA